MADIKGCVNAAREALNLFTSDELERYIKLVGDKTRELEAGGIPFARRAAIKEINQQALESLNSDLGIAANDVEKFSKIERKLADDVKQRGLLEKTRKNRDYNVETAQNADRMTLKERSFGELEKEDLDILAGNELNDEIYAAADDVNKGDSRIRKIADRLKDYVEFRNSTLIRSNALHPDEIHSDRYFKSGYNQSKLAKMGKENFVAAMRRLIDVNKTFKGTKAIDVDGLVDEAIVSEMIGNTFDNIIRGDGVLFTKASVAKDLGKIKKSRQMFYVYKDWRSWGEGNKIFGDNSLIEAWMSDIHVSGSQSGMAKIFGSDPQSMYNKAREIEVAKRGNSAKQSVAYQTNDAIFSNQLKSHGQVWNPTIANVGAATRAISSMSKLSDLVLKSLSDNAQVAGMAQRLTGQYWKPYVNAIVNNFNLIPQNEGRQYLAKLMHQSLRTHMGVVARKIDYGDMGAITGKLSNKFFWLNGIDLWDAANKLSAMEPVMRAFGKASKGAFDTLNKQMQSALAKFNISPIEWDGLRAKSEKGFFTVDNVNRMSDAELKELWNMTDKSSSLLDYRDDLYRKVFSMFDTAQEFASLNSTAYTRMLSTGNLQAGTLGGEVVRNIMQFKSYPIQYFRRVVVGGMQDMDSWQAKLMYATNMAMGTIMLEYMSQALSSVARGVTPPDPSKMSTGERAKYFGELLSGGFGVFNRIMDTRSQDSSLFLRMFNTASMKMVEEPLVTAFALASGNLKGAEKAVKDFVGVANPFGSVPILSPYVNDFLGQKPYMGAGQERLYGGN